MYVHMKYPARLVVNGQTIHDWFPDWDDVLYTCTSLSKVSESREQGYSNAARSIYLNLSIHCLPYSLTRIKREILSSRQDSGSVIPNDNSNKHGDSFGAAQTPGSIPSEQTGSHESRKTVVSGGQGKSALCNSALSWQRGTPHGDRSPTVISGGNANGQTCSVNNAASSVPTVQRNDKNTYAQNK